MKNIILFAFFSLIYFNMYTQSIDYQVYESNNKLFINKDMPIYLWVSTSDTDNKNDILMTSQSSSRYANPMYLDTEGHNTYRYNYTVNPKTKTVRNQQVIFMVYADGKAPRINAKFVGKRKYARDGSSNYINNLKIVLSATDYTSGLKKIMYSIDNQEYIEYSSPINISNQGNHKIQYYAVDNVGNKTDVKSHNFVIYNNK